MSAPRAIADWEPLRACWTAWPWHSYAWGRHLGRAQDEMVAFCRAVTEQPGAELIELLCEDADAERQARARLTTLGPRVRYRRLCHGDIWLRDTAPLFVQGELGELSLVRLVHTGWGGKFRYPNDAELAERLEQVLELDSVTLPLALEGGALELDGAGHGLTTDSCALSRNPDRDRRQIETLLSQALGLRRVTWLSEGLLGDHTDGHIDNVARFAAPGVVLHMQPSDGDDPQRDRLEQIAAELVAARDGEGRPLRCIALPSPGRVEGDEGVLPASYCNFYVGNRSVVVPAFGRPQDEAARRVLAETFPDRTTISSPALSLLDGGGGTFHCMTRGEPLPVFSRTAPK